LNDAMSAAANPGHELVLARIGSPLARSAPDASPDATIDLDLADAEPADEPESDDAEHTERSDPPALMESGEAPLFQTAADEPEPPADPSDVVTAITGGEPAAPPAAAKLPDATSALLLTRPAQRRPPAGRFARWARRAAVATLVLPALLAGGAYFAHPFLPAWLVPTGLVEMVDGWIERLPHPFDDVRGESATPASGRDEVHGESDTTEPGVETSRR
jgi:hypothetical protein